MERSISRQKDCEIDRSIIGGLCTDMSREEQASLVQRLQKSRQDTGTHRRKRRPAPAQMRMNSFFKEKAILTEAETFLRPNQ
jgi:hypothetical protein